MINADMIEDVQFSSGGFPAQYGDKSSAVMNLTVREGTRSKRLAGTTGFDMAGAGFLGEGCVAGGRGSWILSVRKSLLEVADAVVGISTISLTAVPKYHDTQARLWQGEQVLSLCQRHLGRGVTAGSDGRRPL